MSIVSLPAMALLEEADGRRLRREHNREAVLDALTELFAEGNYQPSTTQIAERAGLSPRSLFRYFEDVDDLHRAAVERQLEAAQPLLEFPVPAASASGAARVAAFVEARVRLFDAIAPAARAARVNAHRHPVIARQVRRSRAYLRRQVQQFFADELRGHSDVLPAIDALCSFETYDLLRGDQSLSRASTIAALVAALNVLLPSRGGLA
jgi:AcrR family transcriptional regulator